MSRPKVIKVERYHSHIYFTLEEYDKAERVRSNMRRHLVGIADVYDLVDYPIGPHTMPMFEIDFPAKSMGKVVEVLLEFREGLSILIHPLSGDHYADHTEYPIWIGKPVELKTALLKLLKCNIF